MGGGSGVDSQTSQFLLIILPGAIWGINLTQDNRIGSGQLKTFSCDLQLLHDTSAIFFFDMKKSRVTFPPEAHQELCDMCLDTREGS